MAKNPTANAGDMGSIPHDPGCDLGLGRSHLPRGNEARESQLLSQSSRVLKLPPVSPRTTATETPSTLEPVHGNKDPA